VIGFSGIFGIFAINHQPSAINLLILRVSSGGAG
jgi:hypothetical protein